MKSQMTSVEALKKACGSLSFYVVFTFSVVYVLCVVYV